MAHKILNTPCGIGQIPAGNVLVGNGYTDNLATFNGKIFVFDFDNQPDPYNPLNLPKNTIRVKFANGYTPPSTLGDTQELVDSSENIWDIYKRSNDWNNFFSGISELIAVLGGNTKTVTGMGWMFGNCTSLTYIPLFDLSSARVTKDMFNYCIKVEQGALALYNSIKDHPPEIYENMFINCGRDTQTGAAELAQIPDDWK